MRSSKENAPYATNKVISHRSALKEESKETRGKAVKVREKEKEMERER